MKRSITTLILAAGFAAGAIAQEAAEEAKHSMLPEFTEIDENEDGTLDQAEVVALNELLKETQAEVEFEFETADANEDGLIDQAEYAEYEEMLS